MKKSIFNLALVASAISIIASCSKVAEEEIKTPSVTPEEENVDVQLYSYKFGIDSSSEETKSEFSVTDKYVTWTDDALGVYAVNSSSEISSNQNCEVVTSPSLSFTIKSKKALTTGDAVYAYYPYSSANNESTYQNPNNVQLTIKSSQAQDADAFDSSAMPMVAKYNVESDLAADTEEEVAQLKFVNLAGILDFKVYSSNAMYQTENVKSVTFRANSSISGSFSYNLSGLDYDSDSSLDITGYTGTEVTTTVTNPVTLTGEKATAYDVCMAVAPGSYTGVVEVVTDKAVYTYTISSAKTVGRSQILSLGVNLGTGTRKSIDPTTYNWTLVKNVASISLGEYVAFAASGSAVAMSTDQRDNNRGQVAITKSENALTAASTMQFFEVVEGAASGQYAFKAVNGDTRGQYICAASNSSNYLRSKKVIDGNSSWSVSVTGEGVATVTAQGTFTRNLLQYNSGNSIFAAYASAQQSIAIYILDDPSAIKLRTSTTAVNFEATDGSGDGIDVYFAIKNVPSWTVSNSNSTDFTVGESIIDESNGRVSISPKSINNTYSPRSATVNVSATGATPVNISVNQAAKVASLTAVPDKNIATKDGDIIEIEIESNVPWSIASSLGSVEFVDGSYDPFTSSDYTAPATSSSTVYATIPENTTGANREITITITPNEVGCGLSNKVITVNQLGTAGVKLSNPENVTITNISIATKNFAGSWSAVDNATNYDWMISTSPTAPANTSDATVKAYGNETTTSFSATAAAAPAAGTVYYLYVKANGSGTSTPSDYVQAHAILYQHVFATGQIGNGTTNNVALSGIKWNQRVSEMNNYNNGYAGLQFGSGSKKGNRQFTSSDAWGEQESTAFKGYTTIKKVVVWMNAGSGTPTATVTIDGVAATSDGTTVSKNTSASGDYTKTTAVTYTPALTGKKGVVVINAQTSSKAGYICAFEVLSE